MDEKILQMLDTMYADLKQGQNRIEEDIAGIKEDIVGIKEDIVGIKEDIVGVKEDVQSLSNKMVLFENEIKEDIRALYDGYKLTYEKVQEIDAKIEKQEVEIKVIQGGKK
ncbi:MAG: hypothetical protein ACM3KR_11440 [Deltaproteobacteria bacterium]